ncbi:helix-turn-helix domain-containing protein [Nocardia sp. CDC160]|uniref:helix-turn-helix domain-containing protein n=1 Tax=Nocardia sp. CDC160 TaxID=3112166 RepID=UPI002DB77288|nr:helix-turn-helix transcriptional regulator [Nocardia sp. CDC160]MEC3917485.1 helix-turn-helix transcriptional regulator [Nocardia sp. CDC160]
MTRGEGDPTIEPHRRPPTAADQLAREIKRLRQESDLSQRVLASMIGYSRQYVTMTEWEGSNLPSPEIVAAIDNALEANGALVALRAQADADRQAKRRTAATSFATTDEPGKSLTANVFNPFNLESVPSRYAPESGCARAVAWSDVEQVKEATRRAATAENLHGGGSANTAASQQLYAFAPLVRGRTAPEMRRALFEAVGNLSAVAAFAAFDIADFATADQHSRFALWCADAAGSWDLRASTLADMARMAAYTSDVDKALSLIELAQVRSDRLSSATRAMLSALRAQFLAALGRTDEALSEVARSDDYFADSVPGEDPPWMCYYDEAEHLGSTGKALIPVALARNQMELAAPRIGQAIRRQGQSYPRSRTFSLTRLATLTMRIGDPKEGAKLGMQAASQAKTLHSRGICDELQVLSRASIKHLAIPEVHGLYSALTNYSETPEVSE